MIKNFLFQSKMEFVKCRTSMCGGSCLKSFLLSPSKYIKNQNTSKISRLNYYFFCLSKHVSFRTVLVNCEWNRVDFLINL